MKRMLTVTLALLFLVTLPLAGLAMDHEKMDMDHKMGMDHGFMDMDQGNMETQDMDHGMMMENGMIMLGEQTENGVSAMGHAKAYDSQAMESMAKMGMAATHHFMVFFKDQQTGQLLTDGSVAVKVKKGDQEGSPVKMMQMGEGFGADITLPEQGEYHLKVGSKFADGRKRQYEFDYSVK